MLSFWSEQKERRYSDCTVQYHNVLDVIRHISLLIVDTLDPCTILVMAECSMVEETRKDLIEKVSNGFYTYNNLTPF